MITDTWTGCYPSRWKGIIISDAIAHPAKFSSRLTRRIYEHMINENWIKEGDLILDCFGGVALGALDAMRLGLRWIGVELEPRFVDLGNQNIALWNKRFSSMPHWGDAVLIQGDSRNLAQVLGIAEGCVSSPPYSGEIARDRANENYAQSKEDYKRGGRSQYEIYGLSSGNLGNMKSTAAGLQAAISSPPYSEARIGGIDTMRRSNDIDGDYGTTSGQLGAMKANGFRAAVSSPPFENTLNNATMKPPHDTMGNFRGDYGNTAGNIGNDSGNDFWAAAHVIVEQVYQVLAPGGHAVWVVKAFVKNKQIMDFPGQWRQLCEAVGFITLHKHHALLVHSTEHDFDGKEKRRESKSFFRRLAENKGSPRIDFEVVLCMERP